MTDKERLEAAKLMARMLRVETRLPYNFLFDLVDWLVEQAERVHELEQKNKRYREALELIREQGSWGLFTDKYAKIAHEALEGEEIEQEIS